MSGRIARMRGNRVADFSRGLSVYGRVETCIIRVTMGTETRDESMVGLAFETSCAIGSIAVGAGARLIEARTFSRPRQHAKEFLPTIHDLCSAHGVAPGDVRRVYVSSGPGSFTGLRIGVTVARMLALAVSAEVIAVPTLQVIALNALGHTPPPNRVVVILDAKRARVYAAAFIRRGDSYEAVSEPAEVDPRVFLDQQERDTCVLGEGIAYHREAVEHAGLAILPDELNRPRAEIVLAIGHALAENGQHCDPRDFVPTYIRPPEAQEKWDQRQRAMRKD